MYFKGDEFNIGVFIIYASIITTPLAIWKIFDIIAWLLKNINITFG